MSPALSGIRDVIKRRTAATSRSIFFGKLFLRAALIAAPFLDKPVIGPLLRRMVALTDEQPTAGYTLPLNVEIAHAIEPVTLPIDLMKETVRSASFRALMHECVCRKTFGCADYPHDLGCVFLGPGARACVKNGLAREASVEECCAHIDRAAALGLPAKALWVEAEEWVWGIEDDQKEQFLEFCFCCPCCCVPFEFERRTNGGLQHILHRSIGWATTVDAACTGCGTCVAACPRQLITVKDGRAAIDPLCGGCGLCVPACPSGALTLLQTTAQKEHLTDYFEGLELRL